MKKRIQRIVCLFLSLWLLGLTACQQKEPEEPLPVPAPEGTIPCSPEEAKTGVAAAMEPGKVYTYTDGYLFDVTQLNHVNMTLHFVERLGSFLDWVAGAAQSPDSFIAVVTITGFTRQAKLSSIITGCNSVMAITPVRVERILKTCPDMSFCEGEEILLNHVPVAVKNYGEWLEDGTYKEESQVYEFATSSYETPYEIIDAFRYQHTYIVIAYPREGGAYMNIATLGIYDIVSDEDFETYAQELQTKIMEGGIYWATKIRKWYKENFGDVIQEYLKK